MTAFGPYWTGDTPATPLELDIQTDEDLTAYTSATLTLYSPDRVHATAIGPVPITDGYIQFTLPADPFPTPGIYTVTPKLTGQGTVTLDPQEIAVQEDDGWHNISSVRSSWATAQKMDAAQLYRIIQTAKAECIAFAPAFTGRPPVAWLQAHLLQIRDVYGAVKSSQGNFGDDPVAIPVYPMSWITKAILRPQRGIPAFG